MGDTTMVDLLERLEAMAARLDAQAATMSVQAVRMADLEAENAEQSTWLADLASENARQAEDLSRLAAPVAAPQPGDGVVEPKLKRRGMLAKVLGATAAAALLAVSKEAATASADTRTTVAFGGTTGSYGLLSTNGVGLDPLTYIGNLNGKNFGVIGTITPAGILPPVSAGVYGSGGSSSGVLGLSSSGYGVVGLSTNYFGLWGTSSTYAGVGGVSDALYGVWGQSQTGQGVYGESTTGGHGVFGRGHNTATGVWGESLHGYGVYGQSSNNYGSSGVTYKVGYGGVLAFGGAPGTVGLFATSVPGAGAAYFAGAVTIAGPFQVVGGPKNALVPHPDGSHRRMYCQEATEPWFEDFGTAQLVNGQTSVPLDPDFDALVKGDDYRVFLTEIGDCGGLFVSRKGPHQFVVKSRAGAAAAGSFDYRVVSRRKEDVGKRMEKVDLPKLLPVDHARMARRDQVPTAPPPPTPRGNER